MPKSKIPDELREHIDKTTKAYYSRKHEPVVFTKAESDFLIRTLSLVSSCLQARGLRLRREQEKRPPRYPDSTLQIMDNLEAVQVGVDIALATSVSSKLIDSETT